MELYLLRHAIAVEREGFSPPRDRERPLTREGIRRMRRIAHGMAGLRISPDLILTSPFLRASQTAEIVAAELGCKVPEALPHLQPGGDLQDLIAVLRERIRTAPCILLVGHAPALGILASVLLTGDDRMQMTMKKGGLCKLRIDRPDRSPCATLHWLLTPRQLMRLA
jgi:phosphohistidine phosphatase